MVPRVRDGRSVAGRRRGALKRSRTRRHCWRSATRSAPASTSSPTARAARKLFQPLRHRARGRRHRQSGHRRSTAAAIPIPVPRVTGKIRRKHPVEVATSSSCAPTPHAPIKITVPGPFTMSQQAQNDFYKDEEEMALDYAAAVNAEIKDLFAAGADIVQIDEPYMQAAAGEGARVRPQGAQRAPSTASTARPPCISASATPRSCMSKPEGYSFLPEFDGSPAQQMSIETAQSEARSARCWKSCRRRPSSSASSISPT